MDPRSFHNLVVLASDPRNGDPRRRYYALTAAGRRALTAEAERLERLASLTRRRLVVGQTS